MMASSYSEFGLWRALQYRNCRLDKICEIASDVIDEEHERVNQCKLSDSEQRHNSWYARHRIHVVASAFLSVTVLFICSMITRSMAVYIVTSMALVVFRLIGTNRISHPLQLSFLYGLVFGSIVGPLYFFFPLEKKACESGNWSADPDSANIGAAANGTFLCY